MTVLDALLENLSMTNLRQYLYFSPHDGQTLNVVLSDNPGLNEKDLSCRKH